MSQPTIDPIDLVSAEDVAEIERRFAARLAAALEKRIQLHELRREQAVNQTQRVAWARYAEEADSIRRRLLSHGSRTPEMIREPAERRLP